MNSYSKRRTLSTAALMFFLGIALHEHWEWVSLMVPGAFLIWIALVMPMPTPAPPVGVAKKASK